MLEVDRSPALAPGPRRRPLNGNYDSSRRLVNRERPRSARVVGATRINQWNWFIYQGLEFTATKRTAKAQLITTYTRAWQHIDGTWQPNDPASFVQPDAFANDNGLGTIRGAGTNRLPNLKILNLRVGRNFVFGRRRFEAAFDTFNLLNAGSDQQFLNGGNQLYSANYAARPDGSFLGVNRQPPRSGQVTVRYVF